jgi:hypothetical protein
VRDSTCQTVAVPAAGAGVRPTILASAADKPIRVQLDNTGGVMVFYGFAPGDVISADGTPSTATGRLPPGVTPKVVVLAPKQKLYASSAGPGQVTVDISEAVPTV